MENSVHQMVGLSLAFTMEVVEAVCASMPQTQREAVATALLARVGARLEADASLLDQALTEQLQAFVERLRGNPDGMLEIYRATSPR